MIRRSSSIFNFNTGGKADKAAVHFAPQTNNRRKCRVLFLTLAVIVFFLLGVKSLNYLYWQEDKWSRILWHNYYRQKEKIEYVYLGSSHVYCDLNPEILDGKNRKNNFSLSTGSQRLIESYYLLKEADRGNRLEKAYLELYYIPSTGGAGVYKDKDTVSNGWRNTDYMKYSFHKIDALLGMNPAKYYPEAFFPFVRYREHLADGSWISARANEKNTDNYKRYIYNDGVTEYRDKGYYFTTAELTNLSFGRDRAVREMTLTEDAETYLRKIITYCQKRKIEITLFVSPIYELQPMATENYDGYADSVKRIAAEYGVPYYDFNMAKEEYLPIQKPEYFMDVGHLNAKGAEIYTSFFYQIVSASPEENAEYFYDSYREKLENSKARVLGLYYYPAEESELSEGDEAGKTTRMIVASYGEAELEYQISLTPDDGETVLLQDFSPNKKFNVSAEEDGVCKIVWQSAKDGREMGSMEVRY